MSKVRELPKDPRAICLDVARLIEREPIEPHIDPWPQVEGEPVEYQPAHLVERIADELIRRLDRFEELREATFVFLYRNVKKWESKGRTVFADIKATSGLIRYLAGSADFILRVNWKAWLLMNPWQRVRLVYHELRHGTIDYESGKYGTVGHDVEVFFDELEIFGTETFREWKALAESVSKGREVNVQYHLPLEVAAAQS